jgi:hypothetical protein
LKFLSLSLGIVAVLTGLAQWFWVLWAFGASWHLGSPIRQHRIPTNALGQPLQSVVDEVYSTGFRVIGVLEDTLGLLVVNGLLFLATGIVLVIVSQKLGKLSQEAPAA